MISYIDPLEPRRLMAAGDIDSTFTRVAASITTPYTDLSKSRAIDVAYDIDGSAVMLASVERSGVRLPVLTRFKPDGSTDFAFGRDGIVLIDLGVASIDARSLTIDGAGRINVFSNFVSTPGETPRAIITQFNRTGQLTTSFGSGGSLLPAFASGSGAADVTTDPLTNTIYALSDRGEVLRASPNGRVHAPFGSAGIVDTLGRIGESGAGESIWTDGTKVLVGTTIDTRRGSTDWCVTQLRIGNGSYERAFGRRGFVGIDVAGGKRDQLDMITVDSYGRIMLAGKRALDILPSTSGGPSRDAIAAVARLKADGALDTNFYRTGIADGFKLGIARQSGYEIYECRFSGAAILIGEQQDVYRLYNHLYEIELTLGGREWAFEDNDYGDSYPSSNSDDDGHRSLAQSGKRIITAVSYYQSSNYYNTTRFDWYGALLDQRSTTGDRAWASDLLLVNQVAPVTVGADGRLMTALNPVVAAPVIIQKRQSDGSYVSSKALADADGLLDLFDGVAVPQADGGFEMVYAFRDYDGDSGAYAAWSVGPDGVSTLVGKSGDESGGPVTKLPLGRYSVLTALYFVSDQHIVTVSGAKFVINTYRRVDDSSTEYFNVMPALPEYAVPIIGSDDLFAIGQVYGFANGQNYKGPQYIGRYTDSNTLSPAFNNGQPLEINNVDLLYGQADGRLLYTIRGQKGLRRLNTDGTGDLTFGTGGGWMAAGFDHFDIDNQGRLIAWRVLTGGASDGDVQIMRFSQNGKVDTTFGGGDGLIIVDAKLPSTATANVIVDTNDNLVVTAHRQSASAISWSATRILGD